MAEVHMARLRGGRANTPLPFFVAFLAPEKNNEKVDPGNVKQVRYKRKKLHLSVKLCKQGETNTNNF